MATPGRNPGILTQGPLSGPSSAYALTGFNDRATYRSVANQSLSPICWGVVFRMRTAIGGFKALIANINETANTGFSLYLNTSNRIQARIYDGGGTQRNQQQVIAVPASATTIHVAFGQYSAGLLTASLDKNVFATSAAFTGFTPATTAEFCLANDGGTVNIATSVDLLGGVLGYSAQTVAQKNTWADRCKAANDVVDFVTGACSRWSVKGGMGTSQRIIWQPQSVAGGGFALQQKGPVISLPAVHRNDLLGTGSPSWAF